MVPRASTSSPTEETSGLDPECWGFESLLVYAVQRNVAKLERRLVWDQEMRRFESCHSDIA